MAVKKIEISNAVKLVNILQHKLLKIILQFGNYYLKQSKLVSRHHIWAHEGY